MGVTTESLVADCRPAAPPDGGRDGRIRDKDTIPPGNDPHPPKDTEH